MFLYNIESPVLFSYRYYKLSIYAIKLESLFKVVCLALLLASCGEAEPEAQKQLGFARPATVHQLAAKLRNSGFPNVSHAKDALRNEAEHLLEALAGAELFNKVIADESAGQAELVVQISGANLESQLDLQEISRTSCRRSRKVIATTALLHSLRMTSCLRSWLIGPMVGHRQRLL